MNSLKLLHPQEVETIFILPLVRKYLALEMKSLGYPQKEIANKLFITEPAVSQYLKEKRATRFELGGTIKERIRLAAQNIIDKESLISEVQGIMSILLADKTICRIHEQVADLPSNCDICFQEVKVNG